MRLFSDSGRTWIAADMDNPEPWKRLARHLLRLDQVLGIKDKLTVVSNIETEAESLGA